MKDVQPTRPATIDPIAADVLDRLAESPAAAEIVLGGHFALKHYLDFRSTHDIDAWWRTGRSTDSVNAIRAAMSEVAADRNLDLSEREFGDTLSLELADGDQRVFSFQVALRSVELEAPRPSPWGNIAIETLADNVGAKMNALVGRGLPRDFVDVYRIVGAGLATDDECWSLWQAKNPGKALAAAKNQVLKHLTRIEIMRPLDVIADPHERDLAKARRIFFRSFTDAPEHRLPEHGYGL